MITALFSNQKNGSNAVFSGFHYIPGGAMEDKDPPQMVGSLNTPVVGLNSFTVAWNAATDVGGIFGYEISTNDGVNYTPIGNVLVYNVSNVAEDTEYGVRVRAKDFAGNYSQPLSLLVQTLATPKANGVTVSPNNIVLLGGVKQQFFAVVDGPNNPSQEVTWVTNKGNVSTNGEVTTPPGTSTVQIGLVTATSVAFPDKSGTASFIIPALVQPTEPSVDVDSIVIAPNRILSTEAGNSKVRVGTFDKDGDTYYLSQGFWTINKDADDELFYGVDFGPDLIEVNTNIERVTCISAGVVIGAGPYTRGTLALVKMVGGNTSDDINAENYITFRITCLNGEIFDRTIYFAIRQQ